MDIINLDIDQLTPYYNNAKKHPQEQIEQIKKSIKEFGMCDPIAVWGEDNTVVEGHGRLFALDQLGIREIPCIRLDHLTDDQRKAYTLVHNQTTLNSGWDMEILGEELPDLFTDFDLCDYGFELGDAVEVVEAEIAKQKLCPHCGGEL
jgi:ParB-like chromosome segregation protein Spo0J